MTSFFRGKNRYRLSSLSTWVGIVALLITVAVFSVSSASAGQGTVSWSAPTTYTDGTAVSSIAGYKIYYGTTPGSYSNNVSVGNQTSYTVSNLADATTYYFAVSAFDNNGNTSSYSKEVAYTTAAGTSTPSTLYTIQASAGAGGTISPSGAVVVTKGTSQAFTITPSSGYQIAAVSVDGASVGAVSSYTFSNVTANHTIQATFSSSSSGTTSGTTFAVNCGGPQYSNSTDVYAADAKFSGGSTATTTATISGTTDSTLYKSERYGNFSYSIPVSNGSYNLVLKFAEIYWTAAGKRVFNVAVNGQTVINNLDIYSKVGAKTAYDVTIPVNVTTGTINIVFTTVVDNAKVSAIKIVPATTPAPTPVSGTVVYASNAGGAAYLGTGGVSYLADSRYSGGTVSSTTATISGTSDGTLYKSERFGQFSYTIPVPNGNYGVTLKFAETYWSASGKRVFNVAVNGQNVISNLDIYSKVGKNAAYDVVVPVSVANGAINITFTSVVDNAKVSAILVKSN